jgi:hypothetical protein
MDATDVVAAVAVGDDTVGDVDCVVGDVVVGVI